LAAVQTVFSNDGRVWTKLACLLNLRFINCLTGAFITTVTTISVKRDRFVNLILLEWLSIDPFMALLAALTKGFVRLFGFRWLDNIRGRRLGRIGGILGKFGDLLSKLSVFLHKGFVGFEKFDNLLFKFCNTLLIELFSFRCQFLP